MNQNSVAIRELGSDRWELAGELTRDTVAGLWEQRQRICCGNGEISISLRHLGHVDSAGLAFLVALRACHAHQGRDLRFIEAPQQLMRLVEASGLMRVVPIVAE